MTMRTRELDVNTRAIRVEKREADFVASTATIDSYDEIVEQSWVLDRYLRNPVVLFAHRSRDLPVGVATACAVEGGQLVCTVRFATAAANPLGEQVWQSVREKTLRAVSVGFMPGDVRIEKRNGKDVYVLSNNVLHEISVVPVPANPDAVARAKALDLVTAVRARADAPAHRMPPAEELEPRVTALLAERERRARLTLEELRAEEHAAGAGSRDLVQLVRSMGGGAA